MPGLDYLVGTVESKKAPVEFVVINSAWFCNYRSKLDARNLWLGLPLLQKIEVDRLNRLEEERQSGRASSGRTPERLRVALVHHPKEWLHEGECNSYGDRPNAFRLLAQSCDVILSGHVHGSVEPPSQAYNAALLFTGGATYEGARWRNNFSLLQFDLEEGVVTRRAFEFDPREMRWLEASYGSANQELTRRKSPYRQNGEAPVSQVRNVVTNPNELVGKWRSVYWNEGRTDGRRYKNTVEFSVQVQTVTGNVIPDDDDANASVENAFVLKGTFEAGYLTGTWRSEHPDETKKRWGSLQVQVFRDDEDDESRQPERKSKKADHAPVLRMKGRWIGFDRNGQVKVGQWRFKKLPT